jgi:asparagine synthase (glutamine-hydrolysing)
VSGILGLLSSDGAPPPADLLDSFSRVLLHAGPDAQSTCIEAGARLAHFLLDVSGRLRPDPPMPFSLDGRVWLTADLRLDARGELLARLIAAGIHTASSASDAELLLHAYAAWGVDCTRHLLGDFTFILWDTSRRRLFAARDQLGIKPLYFATSRGSLTVSNLLNALRAHPGVSSALNELSISEFLLFGHIETPSATAFAGISRLPPGHYLLFEQGTLSVTRYWQVPIEEPEPHTSIEEASEEFLSLFRAAVNDRLPAGRAALFMSGGLDSASVAALAHSSTILSPPPALKIFTAVYDNLFSDLEGPLASRTAASLDIPIEFVPGDKFPPFAPVERPLPLPEPQDEPLAALDHDFLSRAARHARIALAGEGGDILFHPQSWPYVTYQVRRGHFATLAGELAAHLKFHGRLPPPLAGWKARLRSLSSDRHSGRNFPEWLGPSLVARLNLRERWQQSLRPRQPLHPFRPAACAALTSEFWSRFFDSQDPGATSIPIQVRMPLFDLRIVQWLLRMPPFPFCVNKAILRHAMRGLLPEEIRTRPKTPLVADPVQKLIEHQSSNPLPPPPPNAALAAFLSRSAFAALTEHPAEFPGRSSRCRSLNYWLYQPSGFELK